MILRLVPILLAEGNALNQMVASRLLQYLGHSVELTANGVLAIPEDHDRYIQAGMDDYITKPLNLQRVLRQSLPSAKAI